MAIPNGRPAVDEIIGYVEPWIARPGLKVDVKVSCTGSQFSYQLVRLIQGCQGENAPPHQQEILDVQGVCSGRYQEAHPGSYGLVPSWGANTLVPGDEFHVNLYVQPYLEQPGHAQVLLSTLDINSRSGFAILTTENDFLEVWIGCGEAIQVIRSETSLRLKRWAHISVSIHGTEVRLEVKHLNQLLEKAPTPTRITHTLPAFAALDQPSPLLIAAGMFQDTNTSSPTATNFFNGRIASPRITTTTKSGNHILLNLDFSVGIPTDQVFDVSTSGRHGTLVNAPTRAVKSWDWDGSEPDWTKAKIGYGAIHFHEDDLDDAAWETDFTVEIPRDAVSGAYAFICSDQDSKTTDAVTFFVTNPPGQKGKENRAKAAIILSTFTYLAYANEHMYDEERPTHMEVPGGVKVLEDENWQRMARRMDLGLSMYDAHRDETGTVFSTSKRPILNVRPGYVHWGIHRPREFSADLLMMGYLEQLLGRGGYDVVTDHDLHLHGVTVIEPYDVVLTGCHPEYPSLETLNAYAAYAGLGGSIMYLGGNGFYWTSVTDPARPHRLEVRRGDQGCRSFSLAPGERIHSLNGHQGGLWRSRGRMPNTLFGVGACAFGTGPGVPYRSTAIAHTNAFSWLWNGISASDRELIGIEGFGGGASGDEIDRLDFDLGSPAHTILLATSTGHSELFGVFNEEVMFPMVDTLGPTCPKVRSDMTYYETSAGGAVFSVGSINWYCSLGWKGYENNCAALTRNVLMEFLRRGKGGLAE
ncbi:hypothetical protein BDW59DRAFT_130739 [Aspergillus cavernicola]|uniref:N,N-dimethylformamidase beta subunit n=1 Tax=Aspergillus cavernicola TaxID=176166 RepID=A0ABR4IUZ2_9EURO